MKPWKERVLDLVQRTGVLRPRDLDADGIPREYLRRLLDEGLLERTGADSTWLPDRSQPRITLSPKPASVYPTGLSVCCRRFGFMN